MTKLNAPRRLASMKSPPNSVTSHSKKRKIEGRCDPEQPERPVWWWLLQHYAQSSIEILFGGIVPLLLLSRASLRTQPHLLFLGSLLATSGVVFNRINVVLLAMNLKGPMPQGTPASYAPSVFVWGLSVGLIAATVFLFGLGARLVPLLPKYGAAHGD
jgi:Ni/Fe-hydrogenase subunit HybB-like protein